MDVMTYTKFRKNLASTLDKVNDDCSPMLIARENGKHAVLLSLKDYNAMVETVYLLGSSENAERLQQSLASLTVRGNIKSHRSFKG